MVQVVPAILPEGFNDLEAHVARVKGLVTRVQIDIANKTYAPSKTWPYTHDEHFEQLVNQYEGWPFWEDVSFELDMLIRRPEDYLSDWISTGVSAVIIHIESTKNYSQILKNIRTAGIELGWALKPSTPNEELFKLIETHGESDFVQCMGSDDIGYHGVELDEVVYEKVTEIRARYPELPIAVDIGVNRVTAPKLVDAGVTKLVSGSGVFEAADIKEAIDYFQQLTSLDG